MLDRKLAEQIERHHDALKTSEEQGKSVAPGGMEGYAQGTATTPLSMCSPELWSMCFPDKFPYGDGVFGLSWTAPMSFQQCTSMHLLREELVHQVTPEDLSAAATSKTWGAGGADGPGATGRACAPGGSSCGCPVPALRGTPRQDLRAASSEELDAAAQNLGPNASLKDALRSPAVDQDVRGAFSELMVFTAEVLGSDGARAKLRHEQNGFALVFGGAGGFPTPNVADARSPILLALHSAGGCETHAVDLLAEAPDMPSARRMLQIVAQGPVAHARFFIFTMQIFCEHVLGTGPWDSQLRHNGRRDGAAFPDGFASSCAGGAFLAVAALHGPIEEQARLSIHPRILLWFAQAQSEQWPRCMVNMETEEIRRRLRAWQEKTLAAAQSMQLDSAAVLPLLLTDDPGQVPEPRNTPFSEKLQQECRMDGELEHDVKEPEKRRVFLATEPSFEDRHLRRHQLALSAKGREAYRLLRPVTDDDLETAPGAAASGASDSVAAPAAGSASRPAAGSTAATASADCSELQPAADPAATNASSDASSGNGPAQGSASGRRQRPTEGSTSQRAAQGSCGADDAADVTHAFAVHGAELALAMVHGYKLVEKRHRKFSTGWYALHGGRQDTDVARSAAGMYPDLLRGSKARHYQGAVVGLVRIGEHRGKEDCNEHAWAIGPVCNVLSASVLLDRPVAARGNQGQWPLPAEVRNDVLKQIRAGDCVPMFFDIGALAAPA
ncbi:unnamed protein product [Prorocentrum cordatum]|uniref:Uncharacterized protein n=1 Tax=Prorocentrum cordatum TaxID=2364126 RepID=A0ABN9U3U0_9DINO|nr:unnamed protein product [Polarella glacialis]